MEHGDKLEQEIVAKGLTAPRVTPEEVANNIEFEYYFTAADAISPEVRVSMVSRFLGWPVPADFYPDGYVSFYRYNVRNASEWPTGMNLLTATQARDMLTYVLSPSHVPPALRRLTFCVLVLKNGYAVTGESACVSSANFDAGIGRSLAKANAVRKVYDLMGYELRTKHPDV